MIGTIVNEIKKGAVGSLFYFSYFVIALLWVLRIPSI
jgi:hypothetical protein